MDCHWSKHVWFASFLGVVFNSHASRYTPFQFQEWLKRNIIDANEDIIVNVMVFEGEKNHKKGGWIVFLETSSFTF